MSDCGGLIVACLAAPLLLAVLVVAGVSYLALKTANLLKDVALEGLQLAGSTLSAGVRAVTRAVSAGAAATTTAIGGAAQWATSLFDSGKLGERLRATAHSAYSTYLDRSNSNPLSSHAICGAQQSISSALELRGPTSAAGLNDMPRSTEKSVTTATSDATPLSKPAQKVLQNLARAKAVSHALNTEIPLKLVAEQHFASQLSAAQYSMTAAESYLRSGDLKHASYCADQAEAVLTSVAHTAHQRLVGAERATIAAQVGNTLEEMGYEVKAATTKDHFALVGRREHHAIAMVVGPSGKLELDMAGFEGSSCTLETKALLDGLRRNGLVIGSENIVRHGKFSGGPMIRAAQRHGKTLELALAEMANSATQDASVLPQTPVRRSGRLHVDPGKLQQARAWMWNQHQAQSGGRS